MSKNNLEKIITNDELRNKIYIIRGKQVMLDFDLARIYGYTTSAFNQQVQRNIKRFEGEDFMFELGVDDPDWLSISKKLISISQFVTSIQTEGTRGGRAKPIRAFTEQGIYMLMTVLKGDLAVKQSRTLIRMFKAMKDYILENQNLLENRENLQLMSEVMNNSKDLIVVKNELKELDNEVKNISTQMNTFVKKSEISPILLDFSKVTETREFLIMNGEPARAKETFMDIYSKARSRIYVIDNYIDIRTLHLLQDVKENVKVTFFTDNIGKTLHRNDYDAFKVEQPDLEIKFTRTNDQIHDRFIIIDDDRVYQCGASFKDAGNKLTSIYEVSTPEVKQALLQVIQKMLKNPELDLK